MDVLDTHFISRLSVKERHELFSFASTKIFNHKEFLYNSDRDSNHVYIIKSGRVKIYELSDKGKETILWFCFSGEIFGLAELYNHNDRKIYAEACCKTEVYSIKASDFNHFLASHHHISMYIIQLLSYRMRLLADMLLNISSDDVYTRLIKLLNHFALHYGNLVDDYYALNIKLTHQEIGDMIGASRQTISSTMTQLYQSGLIDKCQGNIRIHERSILQSTGSSQHE